MKLRDYIKKIGKTVEQVASDLQVSAAAVSRWQSGKAMPRPDEMRKIMRWSAGKVTANDFYSEKGA